MKQLLIFSAIIFCCGIGNAQPSNINLEDKEKCEGEELFIIDSAEAAIMIDSFERNFKSKIGGFYSTGWMDINIVRSINNVLERNSSYDGVCILLSGKSRNIFNKATFFAIMPTIKEDDTHRLISGRVFGIIDSFKGENIEINISQENMLGIVRYFLRKFRKHTDDSNPNSAKNDNFSKSIWIRSCVVATIIRYMETKGSSGLRIYNAAYEEKKDAPGQKYPIQSTVVLVPTIRKGNNDIDDWGASKLYSKKKPSKGYNHGELCPTKCPKGTPDNP